MHFRSPLLFALGAGLLLTACAPVKIGRILADPSRYRNRTVQVDGTVVRSAGVMGTGGYQVDDGTGKIYVLSNRGVPRTGARVKVSGQVINGVELMGRSYGTAIQERDHKVKW